MIYLVDLENVSNSGFVGIGNLKEDDELIIFYSEKNSTINMETHKKLAETSAKIEYHCITAGGKNALDFQLSSYLGYLVSENAEGEFFIISKDKSFDFVVNFWAQKEVPVKRNLNLEGLTEMPKESLAVKIENSMSEIKEKTGKDLTKDLPELVKIVSKSKKEENLGKKKVTLNNSLTMKYKSDGGKIYSVLKGLLDN